MSRISRSTPPTHQCQACAVPGSGLIERLGQMVDCPQCEGTGRDPAAVAGLRQRQALRAVSPLQAQVDACVAESDREVARRRAACLARLPIGERSEARPSAKKGASVIELDSFRG